MVGGAISSGAGASSAFQIPSFVGRVQAADFKGPFAAIDETKPASEECRVSRGGKRAGKGRFALNAYQLYMLVRCRASYASISIFRFLLVQGRGKTAAQLSASWKQEPKSTKDLYKAAAAEINAIRKNQVVLVSRESQLVISVAFISMSPAFR